MRDFGNVAEKDCVRLIIAQDLKEFGIDVDTNLGGGLGNLTAINNSTSHRNNHALHLINTSSNLNGTNSSHFHNNSIHSNLKEFISSTKNHNKSNISTNLMHDHNPHDSHLSFQSSKKVFNLALNQLELINVAINEQTLNVPM